MDSFTLHFSVCGHEVLSAPENGTVSDCVNCIHACFSFSDEWKEPVRTAVFRKDDTVLHFVLNSDDCCILNALSAGRWHVSVFTETEAVRRTSASCALDVKASGYADGGAPEPPQPTVYAQILTELAETRETLDEVAASSAQALAGAVSAAESAQSAKAAAAESQTAAESAQSQAAASAAASLTSASSASADAQAASNDAGLAQDSADTAEQAAAEALVSMNAALEAASDAAASCEDIQENRFKRYTVTFSGSSPVGVREDCAAGLTATVGANATPAVNDFDNIPFFCRPRCCATWTGTRWRVNAYQGERDYATDGSNGEVLYECTPFWYRTDLNTYVSVTGAPREGYQLAPMFPDATSKVYLPAYQMTVDSAGKAHSISGPFPETISLDDAMKAARVFDAKAHTTTFSILFSEYLLMLVEFATRDLKSVMSGPYDYPCTAKAVAVAELASHRAILAAADAEPFVPGQYVQAGNSVRRVSGKSSLADGNTALLFEGDPVDLPAGSTVTSSFFPCGICDGVAASSGYVTAVSETDQRNPCIWRGKENPWGNGLDILCDALATRFGEGNTESPFYWEMYYLDDPSAYNGLFNNAYVHRSAMPLTDNRVRTLLPDAHFPLFGVSELGANRGEYSCSFYSKPTYAASFPAAGSRFDFSLSFVSPVNLWFDRSRNVSTSQTARLVR